MMRIASLLFITIPTVLSLDCSGPADVVVAIPGSEVVPYSEFRHIENFLIRVVSYYNISPSNTRIGLVLYGREPAVVSDLDDAPTRQSLNARITILSHRTSFYTQILGGQNVPKAIQKVREMLSSGRENVPKIGVIMTYGNKDLTSTNPDIVGTRVATAAKAALDEGIELFATSTSGTVPGFINITMDTCRLFSLGSYTGLGTLLPYLASATCYVLDSEVHPGPGNDCFPVILPPPPVEPFHCGSSYGPIADPNNCAYFYFCPIGIHIPCGEGTLFDPNIRRCNFKEFVTCYSGLSCPEPKGLFPHPSDCNKYLNCNQNRPYVQTCPSVLVFNPHTRYCDYKKNVNCGIDKHNEDTLMNKIPS